MSAKFIAVLIVAAGAFGSTAADAAEDSVELTGVVNTGLREQIRAKFGEGFEHVRGIKGPERRVTADQIGSQYLKESGAPVSIIGSVSDIDVRTMLELIGERAAETTRVTGDERFAVVQLGDPDRDACCTTTILFENRNSEWTLLADIWQSH